MRFNRIIELVEELIDLYSTRNPYELAEILGILLSRQSLPDGIFGAQLEVDGQSFIFIDDSLDEPHSRYAVAHELFHHIDSHPGVHLLSQGHWDNWFETQADYFAACLLIDGEPVSGETDAQLATRMRVPVKLVHLLYGITA